MADSAGTRASASPGRAARRGLEHMGILAEAAASLLDDGEHGPETRLLLAVQELNRLVDSDEIDESAVLDAIALAGRSGAASDEVGELWRGLRPALAEHIAELRDGQTVPEWIDPEPMASLILAAAIGSVGLSAVDPEGPDRAAVTGQFASLLLAVANHTPSSDRAG